MKAFVVTHAGATTVEEADVPVPQIAADELLVRVGAIGVGIHDSYFLPPGVAFPFVVGIEGAGVVEAVGRAVTGRAPGDRVAFVSSMQPKGGAWAQYAAVAAGGLVVPVPDGLELTDAAALPVAANTVLRVLHALRGLPAGASVFIAGASGALGTLAVQLACQAGWRVAGSASAPNHAFLRELGVDLAVDYHDPDWVQQVLAWAPGGVDAAIAVQPGTTADCLPAVRDGGTVVTVSGDPLVGERDIEVRLIPYDVDVTPEVARLLERVAAGEVRVEVERVHPFDEAPLALAKVQTRHARGKVVLRVE